MGPPPKGTQKYIEYLRRQRERSRTAAKGKRQCAIKSAGRRLVARVLQDERQRNAAKLDALNANQKMRANGALARDNRILRKHIDELDRRLQTETEKKEEAQSELSFKRAALETKNAERLACSASPSKRAGATCSPLQCIGGGCRNVAWPKDS